LLVWRVGGVVVSDLVGGDEVCEVGARLDDSGTNELQWRKMR